MHHCHGNRLCKHARLQLACILSHMYRLTARRLTVQLQGGTAPCDCPGRAAHAQRPVHVTTSSARSCQHVYLSVGQAITKSHRLQVMTERQSPTHGLGLPYVGTPIDPSDRLSGAAARIYIYGCLSGASMQVALPSSREAQSVADFCDD